MHAQVSSCDLYQTDKALFPSFRLMGRESTPPSHVTLCFTVCEGKTVFPLIRDSCLTQTASNTKETHVRLVTWMYPAHSSNSINIRTVMCITTSTSLETFRGKPPSSSSFPVHFTVYTSSDFSFCISGKTKRSEEKIVKGIKKQFIILSFQITGLFQISSRSHLHDA